jgi:hypothetical protein
MNETDLLLTNLNLKTNDFHFFNSYFLTEFNLSQLEQNFRLQSYINNLNNTLNNILNSEKTNSIELKNFLKFFSNHINPDFTHLLFLVVHIEELRKTIFNNIDNVRKIKNLNDNEKDVITSKLYEINDELSTILTTKDFIDFKSSINIQEKFNNDISKLLLNVLSIEDLVDVKKFIISNYKDNLKNIISNYDNIYDNIFKLNNKFMIETNYILKKFIEKNIDFNHLALRAYININNNNDYSTFNKDLQDYKHFKDNNYKGIAIFSDRTSIIEKKDGSFELLCTKKQKLDIKDKFTALYLREKYNKNPIICKEFIDIIKLNKDYNIKESLELFDKYIKNIDIFKNYNLNLKEFVINSKPKYYKHKIEAAEDRLTWILLDNSANNIIKKLTSSKNIHLFNEESKTLIKDILNQKIKIESLNQFIGKKMARFKTTEELNLALNQFINLFGFSYEGVINKANDLNIQIVSKENNSVILKIKNFEEASAIGSSSWCICTSETYFNSYVNKDSNQYFVFDFNKEKSSSESLIGITVDRDGELITAHYKDDEKIEADYEGFESYLFKIKESLTSSKKQNKTLKILKK